MSIDIICTNLCEVQLSQSVFMTGLSAHTAQLCSVRVDFKFPEVRVKQMLVNQRTMEPLRNTAQDWAQVIEANTETGFEAFNAALRFAYETVCPFKQIKTNRSSSKNIWDSKCMTLKKAYLEALNEKILTRNERDKRETAIKKKNYDLKLKSLKKKQNSDFIPQAEN
ncbi:hypothetical protein J6590_071836 [Homalodisca vitripennis]|nr:hypothetical protein J6590_071836 [Homalodisca vitripennis]